MCDVCDVYIYVCIPIAILSSVARTRRRAFQRARLASEYTRRVWRVKHQTQTDRARAINMIMCVNK